MIRRLILRLLDLNDVHLRLLDLERHFVTARDPNTGQPTQTLADVPVSERKKLKPPSLRGMSPQQLKSWMEATDGGRNLPQKVTHG